MNDKVFGQPSAKKTSMDDYLTTERQGGTRHDYSDGRAIPRAASNRWHNILAANTAVALGSRMHGHKSEIYISNMRVRLKSNYICYPDVVVVSGEPAFADQNFDLLLNPTVIVEIFSNQTNSSDKTNKLESYLAMESIKEFVLLKEEEMRVEQYARQNAKQWMYRIYNERDDVVSFESINCKVSVSEIYAQVKTRQAELSSTAVN
ncbi:MAG TPA: Uma2 family endonuclease [Pyrinomonadaceae bacterium]|nr:Uma2 family endonuclease [Pyrinomonadaceae bacterium]